MSVIETFLNYKISSCEEAAYLLARYFIEKNFDGDVFKHKEIKGGYSAVISRPGLFKNLAGSKTVIKVTFFPMTAEGLSDDRYEGTGIQIEGGEAKDGIFKEILTYALILPAVRKLTDYVKIFNLSKAKSVAICEKLKIPESEFSLPPYGGDSGQKEG